MRVYNLIYLTWIFISLIFSCSKEELNKVRSDLNNCRHNEKRQKEEIERLNAMIKDLEEEIERYQETPDGLLESINILFDKKVYSEELEKKFKRFIDKYSDHPKTIELKNKYISYFTEYYSNILKDFSDRRKYYEELNEVVQNMIKMCPNCKTIGETKKLLNNINEILNNWPVDIGSIREMKLRYSDLKGKRIKINGDNIVIQPSNYYNCYFENENYWLSFVIFQDREDIHGYCKKSDTTCKDIYDHLASKGSAAKVYQIIFQYPRYNSVCKEDQAIIIDMK